MLKSKPEKPLREVDRKAIFLALVEAQDEGMSLVLSRKAITERFEISDRQMKQIEQEGLEANWPPLD